MALGQTLIDAPAPAHTMAGLLGVETSFAKRRMTLGYREARIASDCALGTAGSCPARPRVSLCDHRRKRAADDPFAFVRDVYGAPEASVGLAKGPGHRVVLSRDRRRMTL